MKLTGTITEHSADIQVGDLVKDKQNNIYVIESVGGVRHDAQGWGFLRVELSPHTSTTTIPSSRDLPKTAAPQNPVNLRIVENVEMI